MSEFRAEKHPTAKLVEKIGKKAFVEMAMQKNTNERTPAEKDRGVRGRVKWNMCEHGVTMIDNFEATGNHCYTCHGMRRTKAQEFKPYFNQGLGVMVHSRSEEKRVAKSMGLVEAG